MRVRRELERVVLIDLVAVGGSFTGQHAIQVRVRRELEQELV